MLTADWRPEWGRIYSWVAMDKNGYLAYMLNNCWGWLPKVYINIPNISELYDDLSEFIYCESAKYENNIQKNGGFSADLFSYWRYKHYSHETVFTNYKNCLDKGSTLTDAYLATQKGIFVFEGIEGYSQGEDFPVGYEGETKMGDYFRHLVPTVYATITDIPIPLRQYVVVSDTLDFTKDRLLDNDKISEYFTRMYSI